MYTGRVLQYAHSFSVGAFVDLIFWFLFFTVTGNIIICNTPTITALQDISGHGSKKLHLSLTQNG